MGPERSENKKPPLGTEPNDTPPPLNAPERVRKPHYDWEHESQAESEARRAKTPTRVSAWKEKVEAWIRRYLLLADPTFGERDDDPTPA